MNRSFQALINGVRWLIPTNISTVVSGVGADGAPRPLLVDDTGGLSSPRTGYGATVTITRPSNTTDYTAGDVIGVANSGTPANAGSAIHEFQSIGPAGSSVLITSASLQVNVGAIPSGMTTFRLHLYDAAPDAILDNAAWDLSSAGDRGKYLGYVDLGATADIGSTLFVQVDQINKQVKLASGSTSLWGQLVTTGGFTPTSGAVYVPKLNAAAL